MNKVLFLARSFPPWEGVATIRTGSIAKYLAAQGWQVTVVTVDPSLIELTGREPQESVFANPNVSRIYTGHGCRALMSGSLRGPGLFKSKVFGGAIRHLARWTRVDPGIGWVGPMMKSCAHLEAGDVDVVLATAPPFSVFPAAAKISERLECPFVMDYRDPWSFPSGGRALEEPWNLPRERRLIKRAGAITIVSQSLKSLYVREFGVPEKTHVITNGFDPDWFTDVEPRKFDGRAVVYLGSLSPPQRTLEPILRAVAEVVKNDRESSPVTLHYFGRESEAVRKEADRRGVGDRVFDHGLVSRSEALSACAGADAFVVVTDVRDVDDLATRGVVTGKIFEALALRRPILLIAPLDSDAGKIVEDTASGERFSGADIAGIAEFLSRVSAGDLPEPGPQLADHYSWEMICGRLSKVLKDVIRGHQGQGTTSV